MCLNHHLLPRNNPAPATLLDQKCQDPGWCRERCTAAPRHFLWETWGYKTTKYIQIWGIMGRSSDLFTTYPMIKFFLFDLYRLFEITKTHGKNMGKTWKNHLKTLVQHLLISCHEFGISSRTFHGITRWSTSRPCFGCHFPRRLALVPTIVDLGKPPWIGTINMGRLKMEGWDS